MTQEEIPEIFEYRLRAMASTLKVPYSHIKKEYLMLVKTRCARKKSDSYPWQWAFQKMRIKKSV